MNGNVTSQTKLKVVLIGDAAVGKTSLSVRFTEDKFGDNYRYTIGGSYCTRSLYVDNKKIMFQIWDTAGTERFKSIVPFYLRDADVAIVAYDITERNTFENINQWLRLLQESAPETIKCALVGNKCDLLEKRQVTTQEAHTFADEHGLYFLETSAKTGQNIQQLFMDIGSIFVGGLLKQHRHNSAITVTESGEPVTSGKCC